MKLITYKGETHTFTEWCKILRSQPETVVVHEDDISRFVKELDFHGGGFSNTALYNLYKTYTEKPFSKSIFEKRIAIAFKKHRPDVVRYKTSRERGWCVL